MDADLEEGRCGYRFPSGRRCRQSVAPENGEFCLTHLRRVSQAAGLAEAVVPVDEALVAEIAELAGDFSSPDQVNRVMGKIFEALLHRRVSAREAGVLCYIAQTILNGQRTVRFIEKNKPPCVMTYINDLPTAIRD
ncbi:MAG TPA: hypothetical protein VMH20_04975 [Verrucomicrobiae bacterium]|nr:hypothetical protein [Verrucomicrobiae bacterium]